MTTQNVLDRIDHFKQRTAFIRSKEDCTEVHWRIDNLEPQQIVDLQHPLGVEWFRAGNCMALHLFSVSEGWHITLLSVPVEIKMQFQFVKQNA